MPFSLGRAVLGARGGRERCVGTLLQFLNAFLMHYDSSSSCVSQQCLPLGQLAVNLSLSLSYRNTHYRKIERVLSSHIDNSRKIPNKFPA